MNKEARDRFIKQYGWVAYECLRDCYFNDLPNRWCVIVITFITKQPISRRLPQRWQRKIWK